MFLNEWLNKKIPILKKFLEFQLRPSNLDLYVTTL